MFTSVLYFNERQRGRVSVQPLSQFLLGSPRPLDDSSAPNMSESAEVSAAASRVLVRFKLKEIKPFVCVEVDRSGYGRRLEALWSFSRKKTDFYGSPTFLIKDSS